MSNYQPVSYQDASPELKALYDEIVLTMKMSEPPNWLLYLGNAPHLAKGMWGMLKSVLVDGHLPPLLQELILFTVAYHRSAPYCLDLHASNVLRMTNAQTIKTYNK
jgi:alkylhydroperoxidase family enzyme